MPEQLKGFGPRRTSIEPGQFTTVTLAGGTVFPNTIDSLTLKNSAFYHGAPGAAGSVFSHSFQLAAGTYDFNIVTLGTYGFPGIIEFKVDGVVILTLDPFLLVGTYNVLTTTTGVVIPTSGKHLLTLTCTGKNAGSADYEIWIDAIWFSPTTD